MSFREANAKFGVRWLVFVPLPVVAFIVDGWEFGLLFLAVAVFLTGMFCGFIPKFWAYALNRADLNTKWAGETRTEIAKREHTLRLREADLVEAKRELAEAEQEVGDSSEWVSYFYEHDKDEAFRAEQKKLRRYITQAKRCAAKVDSLGQMPANIKGELKKLRERLAEQERIADQEPRRARDLFLILAISPWVGLIVGGLLYLLIPGDLFIVDGEVPWWLVLIMLLVAAPLMWVVFGAPWELLMRAKPNTVALAYIAMPIGLTIVVYTLLSIQATWSINP